MIEHAFGKFPTIFVRLKGRNGAAREFNALIDLGAEYCIIPKVDAYALGYAEVVEDRSEVVDQDTLTFASHDGYGNAG